MPCRNYTITERLKHERSEYSRLRAFTKKVGDEADRVYGIVMEKLTKAKNNKPSESTSSSSKMDELKKLGELKASGILSEEEFQKEKEKLLNN